MAIEIRQNITQDLRMSQELVMTPQLQQAIKLLQLTRLELLDRVWEEMAENPLLEELEGSDQEDISTEEETPAKDKTEAEKAQDEQQLQAAEAEPDAPEAADAQEIDWEQYLEQYDVPAPSERPLDQSEERAPLDSYLAPEMTLQEHLLWQLCMSPLEKEHYHVGEVIIGNIDDMGYLKITTEELAQTTGVEPEAVEEVLAQVQQFEPIGVASRDLSECLLRQAVEAGSSKKVFMVIEHGLKMLETKNYRKLAKDLGLTFDEVVEAAREIAGFEPMPGREFSSLRVDYVVPDIFVTQQGDQYVVSLNEDGMPRLRVSPYYRALLSSDTEDGKEAKGYIQERMQAALWLIKSINQRQQTLFKVAESIVKFQRDFLDHGVTSLRPLILKDVAEDIEMHESTVSRVTTGKYMHTPQGTFELKFFFSSAIQREDGGDLASRSVKARIKEVIAKEDSTKPLSDLRIAEILSEEFSLKIARRTVSKYRESMGILPSSSRRSYF